MKKRRKKKQVQKCEKRINECMGRRDEMKATLVNRESTSMINTINANVVFG